MNSNNSFLFIDMGYMGFYRFNASKTWYRFSHPDEMTENPKPNWINVPDFMQKYDDIFIKTIENLKKHFNIPWENIILGKDCARKNIWRNEIYQEYKSTREAAHIKSGFDGRDVFYHTHSILIPKLIEKYGVKYLAASNAEADDVIAVCVKNLLDKTDHKIYIVTSDSDYLQLSCPNVKIINLKFKENTCLDSNKDLWKKILTGDKSDNIPACYIRKHILQTEKNIDKFIKCTPKLESIQIEKEDCLSLHKDNIKDDNHILNQKLIDFNFIPNNIKDNILIKFNEAFKKSINI